MSEFKPGEVYADSYGGRWIAAPTAKGVRLYGFDESDTHDPALIEGDVGPLVEATPVPAAREIKPGDVLRDDDGDEWTAVLTDDGTVELLFDEEFGPQPIALVEEQNGPLVKQVGRVTV